MAAYEESLAIMRKLAAADPGNADWQRDVSVSLEKIGDVRLAAGDRAAALAAYEESLAIMRKLVAADPRNAQWQRDVSVGLNRVGDLRLAAGDRAGALASYEESLAIMRKLVAADPGNAQWQADLLINLYNVSTVVDPPRARAVLREALAIVEMLVREGKLTTAQQSWPQLLRNALAKLPPEQAGAR
jgi:tetratricopeptide (TPR) repeat protein